MEANLAIHYIRSLNKDSLMEYLMEQKFTTEARMLQLRDFDGERFLNFTELDLVHWGLKSNEKRKLLNCRNILLARTPKEMPPKVTSSKNASNNEHLTPDIYKNGKRNTIIRNQRPLPALPTNMQLHSVRSADPEISNRVSQSLRYLDMNQGNNNKCEENSEYVDMETKVMKNCVNESSCASRRSVPKILERPNIFNPSARDLVAELAQLRKAPVVNKTSPRKAIQENAGKLFKLNRTLKVKSIPPSEINKPEDYLKPTPILVDNRSDSPRPVIENHEIGDYMEPKPMSFSKRSNSPVQSSREVTRDLLDESRQRYPVVAERPKGILPLVKADIREDGDNIYETDPHFDEQQTRSRSKTSIQKLALPPIPNQNQCATRSASASLPTMPSTFTISPEELYPSVSPEHSEKPNMFSQPVIGTTSDIRFDCLESNSVELTSNDWIDFGISKLPPPPPEFLDTPPSTAKDESNLPRPPKFSIKFDPDVINQWQDLMPHEDSSDEGPDFNPSDCIYYRNTDRRGAKQLFRKIKNLKDHTFLLRRSHTYFLGLTIFHGGDYYNLGIDRDQDGKFYGQSLNDRGIIKFFTLNSFIGYYQHNALTVKKRDGRVIELYLRYFLPHDVY